MQVLWNELSTSLQNLTVLEETNLGHSSQIQQGSKIDVIKSSSNFY